MDLDALINGDREEKSPRERMEEALRVEILTGKLPAGKHIVEDRLCDRYGLSRTPVRESLHHLAQEGLIDLIPNRGAVVRGFNRQDIDDFFYLKSLLEVQCARWAVLRMQEEELDTLSQLFEFMEFYTMRDDMDKMVRINRGFDLAIYQGSHNRELKDTLLRYSAYLRHANAHIRYPAGYLRTVLEEHRAIFTAFMARDPEAAAAATEVHMFQTMLRRK